MAAIEITDSVFYIGVDDPDLDLFENQYPTPLGMCYNSYLIKDESVALFDTCDQRRADAWLANLEEGLAGREPDYLIISHMEPDHSALIAEVAKRYPQVQLVGNARTFKLLDQFNPQGIDAQRKVVADGETLSLGAHELTFMTTPMVHWPEVMMTYESTDKLLFSADAFGKFGVREAQEDWDCEARRYYFNICGKYGTQVTSALNKACEHEIAAILPLHGPMLTDDLSHYVEKYRVWSSYEPEDKGVFVACASVHGHTLAAMRAFAKELEGRGQKVQFTDLTHEDVAEAVEDAFRYDRMVLAACSYDAGVFPPMADFLTHLRIKGLRNRKVALVQNGSWAPSAVKTMKAQLEDLKDIEFIGEPVTIKGALNSESKAELDALADAIVKA